VRWLTSELGAWGGSFGLLEFSSYLLREEAPVVITSPVGLWGESSGLPG